MVILQPWTCFFRGATLACNSIGYCEKNSRVTLVFEKYFAFAYELAEILWLGVNFL